MSTPNPALQAAAPVLIQGLASLKQAVTTILTGDPAQLPLRIAPAIAIMDGQLTLLAPSLLGAEQAVLASDATKGIDGIIARLQALNAPPA